MNQNNIKTQPNKLIKTNRQNQKNTVTQLIKTNKIRIPSKHT